MVVLSFHAWEFGAGRPNGRVLLLLRSQHLRTIGMDGCSNAGCGLYHAVILDFSPCNTTGSRLNGSFCCATGQEACRVVCEPTQTIGDGNAQDEDQIKRQKAL